MSLFHGGSVVKNGLMLHLDAANSKSYSGSGATWSDLSGGARNATLLNTPTYSSQGFLSFDKASSEYATVKNIGSLSAWTIEAWFRATSTLTGQVTMVVGNQYNGSNLNFSMGTNNAAGSYNLCVGFFNGAWRNTTGFAPALNTWYHVIGTYNGTTVIQYVNGAVDTQLSYTGISQSGGEIRIAGRWDDLAGSGNYFPGDISVVRIYNTALQASEVVQNFNATRGRYGI